MQSYKVHAQYQPIKTELNFHVMLVLIYKSLEASYRISIVQILIHFQPQSASLETACVIG